MIEQIEVPEGYYAEIIQEGWMVYTYKETDQFVSFPCGIQGVVLLTGIGAPVIVYDEADSQLLRDQIPAHILRAVMATRLRLIADMLEDGQ